VSVERVEQLAALCDPQAVVLQPCAPVPRPSHQVRSHIQWWCVLRQKQIELTCVLHSSDQVGRGYDDGL
jgi:hypothetical protein